MFPTQHVSHHTEIWSFHRFTNRDAEILPPSTAYLEDFKRLIDRVSKQVHWLSAQDFLENHTYDNQRNVLLTFDDGHREILEKIYPLVKERKIPFVLFITSGFINGDCFPSEEIIFELMTRMYSHCDNDKIRSIFRRTIKPIRHSPYKHREHFCKEILASYGYKLSDFGRPDEEFLSRKQVQKLSDDRLCTIGAHSVSHTRLKYHDPLLIYRELRRSKQELESITGNTVEMVAYPYGASTPLTRFLAWWVGYQYGFATGHTALEAGKRYPRYAIPRLNGERLLWEQSS